jgi:DNA primase catalytic core
MLESIVDSCSFLLNNFPEAQECKDYLNLRLNRESQEKFQFGFFPKTSDLSAIITLVGEDILKETKLFYTKEIEDSLAPRSLNFSFFEHYPLILPYKDAYGQIVALVGRTILSETERKKLGIPKYKNTVFQKRNHVFGLYESKRNILEQDCVYVVEGQFDVIKAIEAGFKNIVGLGNSNMTYYQFSIISRYTNNIFLLLDNDDAGEKGRKRIMELFGKYANIRNFYLPEPYKDIDEYLSNNSRESLSFVVKDLQNYLTV